MNRITKFQLVSLLLIGDVFALFCISGGISAITAAGFAAGSILQLVTAMPLVYFYSGGKSLASCSRAVRLFLLAGVLAWGGSLFSMLRQASTVVYIPYENSGIWGSLAVAGLVALVCVYISSSGIKALARSGVIAAALGAVCIAIVVVSAAIHSDPPMPEPPDSSQFSGELLRGFALSGGSVSFAVLLSFTDDDLSDSTVMYFTCKAIISALVILTAVLVTGGIMDVSEFPAAIAAQLSQPFPVQRIDSLFLIVFSVFAVYSIAVQASAAEYLIGITFPEMKKFRCTSALIIMSAVGLIPLKISDHAAVFAAVTAAMLIAAPAENLIRKGLMKKREV